jgi:hypothetical protein
MWRTCNPVNDRMLALRQPPLVSSTVLAADLCDVRARAVANDADATAAFAAPMQVDFYPRQVVPVGFK